MLVCGDRLKQMGVNLAAYSSAAGAADIDDLMRVLGYEEWNLFGFSYGTRMALTTMRDRPQGLRSVILDSVLPPQVNVNPMVPANFERTLELIYGACAANTECNAAFPDIRQVARDLVATLNATPAIVDIQDPKTGETREVATTGDDLTRGTFRFLHSTGVYPVIPFTTQALSEGDYGILATVSAGTLYIAEEFSDGVYFSFFCNEETPFATHDILAKAEEDVDPDIVRALGMPLETWQTVCTEWGFGTPNERENRAVTSSIPTLILVGDWDPATPPSYARLVAETLTRSYLFEFPATGHGILTARPSCAAPLVEQFLDDPLAQPDGSCASQFGPPEFQLP